VKRKAPGVARRTRSVISRVVEQVKDTASSVVPGLGSSTTDTGNTGNTGGTGSGGYTGGGYTGGGSTSGSGEL
jgi:hypothetical protein